MNNSIRRITSLFLALTISATAAFSEGYDLIKSTPIGSWATTQTLTIDGKGKGQLMQQKQSLVGEETRNGAQYLWVEIKTESFKYKKGEKGKVIGQPSIMKMLVDKSVFKGDLQSILADPDNMIEEIVMQSGDQDPMAIKPGSMMWKIAKVALKWAMQDIQVNQMGSEKVNVPAGSFKADLFEISGSVAGESVSGKQWVSQKVPFGVIKSETVIGSGKKADTSTVELLGYGDKGAVSEITSEAKSLGLQSLFGN